MSAHSDIMVENMTHDPKVLQLQGTHDGTIPKGLSGYPSEAHLDQTLRKFFDQPRKWSEWYHIFIGHSHLADLLEGSQNLRRQEWCLGFDCRLWELSKLFTRTISYVEPGSWATQKESKVMDYRVPTWVEAGQFSSNTKSIETEPCWHPFAMLFLQRAQNATVWSNRPFSLANKT